jgi:hypothetical protein
VARAIEHALTARRARTRYVVTPAARALVSARAVLPGRLWDAAVRATFVR